MASAKSPLSELVDEPTLDELMADPIIQLVMQRDGINAAEIRGQIDRVRQVYAFPQLA